MIRSGSRAAWVSEGDFRVRNIRRAVHGTLRPAAARPHQWFLLRLAVDRPGGDLRLAEHHQLRPRRAVHRGRLPGLDAAELRGRELLGGAGAGAAHHGRLRRRDGTSADLAHLPHGSSVRAAADLRHRAADRRRTAAGLWRVGSAVHHPQGAVRRRQPGLHVPALVSRLGRAGVAGAVPAGLGADGEDPHRRHAARGHRESRWWCARSASTCLCSSR